MRPELSVVLPVRNQADHIAGVIEQYAKEFKGRSWEVILVPNACSDESPKICARIAARKKNIRVVENPAGGWGRSVRVGLEAARGRFLCYTNSARTDPATIPALFKQLQNRPHALAKIRRHTRGAFFRELGSMIYNWECRLLFRISCRDVNGTPKIFPSDLYRRMTLISDGDLLDAEVLAWCQKLKAPILEMPLGGFHRHGGKSTTKLKSALKMYGGAVQLWRRME